MLKQTFSCVQRRFTGDLQVLIPFCLLMVVAVTTLIVFILGTVYSRLTLGRFNIADFCSGANCDKNCDWCLVSAI